MAKTTTEELLTLLDYVHERLLDRLEGMSDEEYLWEPVPGTWSVRAGEDGVFRAEKTRDPDPMPFTTIAWRLWHIGVDCLRGYTDGAFDVKVGEDGEESLVYDFPGTAAAAIEELNAEWTRFRGHVAKLDQAGLERPLGPRWGPFAEDSVHALVLHALDELIHHSAEVAMLRDLYRISGGRPLAA